jgi:two-component system nitrate/nitrite response regulator NarL
MRQLVNRAAVGGDRRVLSNGGQFPIADNPIRIMIVESQQFVADALESLLSRQAGMVVVGNVRSVADSPQWATELDVAILGYRLKDPLAATAAKAISTAASKARMIFVAADESDQAILAAIDAGASAVLYMSMASADLIKAIRMVAAGGSLISPQTIARMLSGRRKTDGLRELLTCREREVLVLVAEGASNRAIATVLGISYLTVRSHMRNMAGKLAAHSKLEVLVRARQLDLVSNQLAPTIWDDAEFANAGAVAN